MVRINSVDEMMGCPCGVVTDQAIIWDFDKDNIVVQPLCRTCQKEIATDLLNNN